MPGKVDLKKMIDGYRAVRGEFRLLELRPQRYLAIDGMGDPNSSPEYAATVATLYPVAYALKFASRSQLDRDYVVPPLEGLWWAEDMAAFTTRRDKSRWSWCMLMLIPEWVPGELVVQVIEQVRVKKAPPPRIDDLHVLTLHEGLCVQTLHVGPFDEEGPVLDRLHHEFVPANGLTLSGGHHEIYLSDPRRTAPAKLRTILRQPVMRG